MPPPRQETPDRHAKATSFSLASSSHSPRGQQAAGPAAAVGLPPSCRTLPPTSSPARHDPSCHGNRRTSLHAGIKQRTIQVERSLIRIRTRTAFWETGASEQVSLSLLEFVKMLSKTNPSATNLLQRLPELLPTAFPLPVIHKKDALLVSVRNRSARFQSPTSSCSLSFIFSAFNVFAWAWA